MNKIKLLAFLLLLGGAARASISLPSLLSSNMVLQREKPIKVWGYGHPGEGVTIELNGKKVRTTAGTDGKWYTTLPKMSAGGPFEMVFTGENKVILSNILVGDVWVCSGQSNMEFNLQDVNKADLEIKNADYSQIRLYSVGKEISLKEKAESRGSWTNCTPEQARYFSAVGYFFGRRLHQDLKVPIGLINASWGGTVIESWISSEGLINEETFGLKAQQVARFDSTSYNRKQRKLNSEWITTFNSRDSGYKNQDYLWGKVSTADWKNIQLPSAWEFTEKPDLLELDGVVWLSRKISLKENDLMSDATLSLGVILNADQTFVNGILVGSTADSWGKLRNYTVPRSVLKTGTNTITVRVENYGGDGGMMSKPELVKLKTSAGPMALAGLWQYRIGYKMTTYDRPEKELSPNTLPTLMYNNMISPLTGLSIKGFIWYQGESNWDRGYQYRNLLPMLIADWRKKFGDAHLPFLYVQLANFHKAPANPEDSYWAEVREAQDLAQKTPYTGMITAIDLGDPSNIHPKNKQEVGRRLAMLAEQSVYRLPVDSVSAQFRSFKISGTEIILTASETYKGLKTKSGEVKGFQIAGKDRKWYWAQAKIIGKSTISVSSKEVKDPVAIRYAWADNPESANVVNSENLPLMPFRTDDWPGITYGKK
ncbi:sialate O-acetylesterase [Pedobacter jeongneungensis]|uniref:sialate O-acetylesterase n=1 Tax=Pedobacter jeongneungensis TaxID=947309 RepID=UPI00046B049E|nr:sialate O-acetylesterase [Pedobacter jeongneungensis]